MKTDVPLGAIQQDSWNCGIGLVFGIMRFVKAFNISKLSYDWVSVTKNGERLIIPSYVFHSIRYSVKASNQLHNLRMEVINFINAFSLILQQHYNVLMRK